MKICLKSEEATKTSTKIYALWIFSLSALRLLHKQQLRHEQEPRFAGEMQGADWCVEK